MATLARISNDGKLSLKGEFVEGGTNCSLTNEGDFKIFKIIEGNPFNIATNGRLLAMEIDEGAIFEELFDPSQITNLTFWLDATQVAGNDGDLVSTWRDMSGNGYDAIVNAPLTAPVLKANILNGNPVVRFVAANNNALRAHPAIGLPYTSFIVGKLNGGVNGRVFGSIYPNNQNYLLGWWNGREDVMYAEGFIADLAPASTELKLYTGKGTGALTSFYKNGVLLAENANGVQGMSNGVALGGYSLAGVEELSNCDIAEVIMYNRILITEEQQKVEQYLREKWGVI